jgi:ElaB/YqjD/DUF883 family membrane-anchored ribosome-binding protein
MDETRTPPSTADIAGTSPTTPSSNGSGTSSQAVDRLAQSAHQAVDRVAAAAAPTIEKLKTRANEAAETLHAKADEFGAMEEQWVSNARTAVRDHPLAAVAIGVLVGMVIGRATGHGRRDD